MRTRVLNIAVLPSVGDVPGGEGIHSFSHIPSCWCSRAGWSALSHIHVHNIISFFEHNCGHPLTGC